MTFRTQAPLKVIVQLSVRQGSVLRAQCQCKASALMRCAHVAAVLMSLEKHVQSHGHSANAPSTSLPCVWNQGRKRKNDPQALHQAQYSVKRSSARIFDFDPRPTSMRSVSTEDKNESVHDLGVSIYSQYNMMILVVTYVITEMGLNFLVMRHLCEKIIF